MSTKLRDSQVFVSSTAQDLATFIANNLNLTAAGSLQLPGGIIFKWGSIGALGSIGANANASVNINFSVPFPTSCDFIFAVFTPTTSLDFYGVTSLISKSTAAAQLNVRNGATAQGLSGGIYCAIGK